MLQEQEVCQDPKNNRQQEIHTDLNSKPDRPLIESQLDFQKNYPKNIFIPMIQYLAQIGFKRDYEECVGSREQFQGKNVVSLGLIHKLMGAEWFKQSVEKKVLISTISNKILMNSKIKKKLFHLNVVKHLFEVFDEDLKQFKKRISKLANSVSEQQYIEDELFEYPSSILYLLRLFFKLISSNDINQQKSQRIKFNSLNQQKIEVQDSKIDIQEHLSSPIEPSPSHTSQIQIQNENSNIKSRHGSKEQYKFYIRKIINYCNNSIIDKGFSLRFQKIEAAVLQRERQLIEKYKFACDVPSWNTFIEKVIKRCVQCSKKSAKITHAMMNQWINQFKEHVTTTKGFIKSNLQNRNQVKNIQKKQIPYKFNPLILKYLPHQY